jgi:hypothetical protein
MAAFPNLPRDLAGRINDLGNLSYLRHEGETYLRRDIIKLFDGTMREYNRRLAIQHDNARQALAEDEGLPEPSEGALSVCASYALLRNEARATRAFLNGALTAQEAFFEANRSSILLSLAFIEPPRLIQGRS